MLAAEGNSLNKVISSADELIKIAGEDFHLDLNRDISYLELVVSLVVKTDVNPTINIQKFFGKGHDVFNDIMGVETSSRTINIVPKGYPISSVNWFDITIEPRQTLPESAYYIDVVYRDRDIGKVMDFTRELIVKLNEILNVISEA